MNQLLQPIQSDALLESKTLRESLIDRTEVLDRVKKLTMLPDDLHVTIEMAASYYEVGKEAINSLIKDNREELSADGPNRRNQRRKRERVKGGGKVEKSYG